MYSKIMEIDITEKGINDAANILTSLSEGRDIISEADIEVIKLCAKINELSMRRITDSSRNSLVRSMLRLSELLESISTTILYRTFDFSKALAFLQQNNTIIGAVECRKLSIFFTTTRSQEIGTAREQDF